MNSPQELPTGLTSRFRVIYRVRQAKLRNTVRSRVVENTAHRRSSRTSQPKLGESRKSWYPCCITFQFLRPAQFDDWTAEPRRHHTERI